MSDATDCVAALQALGNIPPGLRSSLLASKGYAFQALVFKKLGDSLVQTGWQWQHPAKTPTYAVGAGGSYKKATEGRSHCSSPGNVFVQEITVKGSSGATHQLDLSLVREARSPSSVPRRFYPSGRYIGTSIECKNRGNAATPEPISMGEARDLLGLALDLGFLTYPSRRRLFLISAHGITENAANLVEAYGQATVENAAPASGTLDLWVEWVRWRLRF